MIDIAFDSDIGAFVGSANIPERIYSVCQGVGLNISQHA